MAEVTPTDVYNMHSRSVPRVIVPSRTLLGALYIPSEGINSARSNKEAVVGLNRQDEQHEIPSFFSSMWQYNHNNPLTLGYQSDQLLLTDAYLSVYLNEQTIKSTR